MSFNACLNLSRFAVEAMCLNFRNGISEMEFRKFCRVVAMRGTLVYGKGSIPEVWLADF